MSPARCHSEVRDSGPKNLKFKILRSAQDDTRSAQGQDDKRPVLSDIASRRAAGVICLCCMMLGSTAWAAGESKAKSQATKILNSYGEEMELAFDLWDPGKAGPDFDYSAFGELKGLDTGDYQFVMRDRKGLAEAVGEGVYPSTSVYKDPAYQKLKQSGKLQGVHWDFTHLEDQQLSFYKWATAPETPGVKQFYTARALETAGFLNQAIKAYHAVAVHFVKQNGWTVWHTPIYFGQRAMDKIEFLTRTHPELGWRYTGFEFKAKDADNLDVSDDRYEALNPGRILPSKGAPEKAAVDLSKLKYERKAGSDHVELVRYENGHWQLRVDGKPFMVKAVAYEPTPVGESTHDGSRKDWMKADLDQSGRIDGPFETWVDANRNNAQDSDEPVVGDFELLRQMGANALRHYHDASNKELLRAAYEKYGLMAVVGNLMGMYAAGSGAEWYEGTDFTNPKHLENMRESIRQTVLEHKDEPYLLMWVLSNEGNYGFVGDKNEAALFKKLGLGSRGKEQYEAMYRFADEMAAMIKTLDPNHPVAFSNGETVFIQAFGRIAKNIDIFGVNAYRGADGFGYGFWNDIKRYTDKPVFLTEFGCPAFHNRKPLDAAEELQAAYLKGNWEDIHYNRAGSGAGNAIGGTAFQFVDEWWKAGPAPEFDPSTQETVGDFKADFPDGWMHEEWLGITSQGDGSHSPYLRQLRKSYFALQSQWTSDDKK